jgi:hypothetical protein
VNNISYAATTRLSCQASAAVEHCEVRRSTVKYVMSRIDWSKRADYVRERHHVETTWADEAVADPEACWLVPDPASTSGMSVRVIGYSAAQASC